MTNDIITYNNSYCRKSGYRIAERFGKQIFITLLRKVGFADRPILGGDCLPNGIRRPFSTLLRKVGVADRIYLCGALINFRRG